jgi:HD-GYP domain-containing protein (c-di-GMP phosphodiesterase class II)
MPVRGRRVRAERAARGGRSHAKRGVQRLQRCRLAGLTICAVHTEVDELQPKLKELLYDCAVEIKATKAALYLFDGTSRFELVTEYGFRGGIRRSADLNDPVADRCGRGRNAFFINGVATEPRFSEILFEASTDRLLVAPLYQRGKLVGFVDMRDKAGKQLFEQSDIPKAMAIAERIAAVFASKNIFGHQFITLSDGDAQPQTAAAPAATAEAPKPAPAPQPVPQVTAPQARRIAESQPMQPSPAPAPQRGAGGHVPRLATLVLEARTVASRIATLPAPVSLSETDFGAATEVLRSILLIPGAVAAALTAFGHLGGVQEIAARTTVSDEAKSLIQSKLNVWLSKRGEAGGFVRTSVVTPFGTAAAPVTPGDLQKVFTAPITVDGLHGVYLTVGFAGNPDRVSHELLAALHSQIQLVLDQSMQRGAIGAMRAKIAEYLVEPDFTKFPALRKHSDRVATLTESFARYLMMPAQEVETARIIGLVHDVGMRLLDYDRLYRKQDLTTEEMGFLREHPAVGAAIVDPLLGSEIARAVLSHHERVDGRGYPNELHGEEIPYLSRVVQLCDAWVAMTEPEGYQPAEKPDDAMRAIANGSGSQFDAELAGRFIEMVRGGRF